MKIDVTNSIGLELRNCRSDLDLNLARRSLRRRVLGDLVGVRHFGRC